MNTSLAARSPSATRASDPCESDPRESLAESFAAIRAQTERLAAPLSAEDACAQSMPDASPTKWHLAHTSWFFETFVLESAEPGFRPFDPAFRVLFNSYYQSVGAQYSRPKRGLLSRPSLDEVHAYRRHVDRHLEALLQKEPDFDPALRDVVVLGLHHEQQHQELILTDVKHLLAQNPLLPAYAELPLPQDGVAAALAWVRFDEGLRVVGHADGGFCFDNETPAHRVLLNAFELASRPVTNGEYLAFVAAGGYAEPRWWVSDGFAAVSERGVRPLCVDVSEFLKKGGGSVKCMIGDLGEMTEDETLLAAGVARFRRERDYRTLYPSPEATPVPGAISVRA